MIKQIQSQSFPIIKVKFVYNVIIFTIKSDSHLSLHRMDSMNRSLIPRTPRTGSMTNRLHPKHGNDWIGLFIGQEFNCLIDIVAKKVSCVCICFSCSNVYIQKKANLAGQKGQWPFVIYCECDSGTANGKKKYQDVKKVKKGAF